MERCEICQAEADMQVNIHPYCAKHYVENEGEECLYWSLHAMVDKNLSNVNTLEEKWERIFEEIKKNYPQLIQRRKSDLD